jgi:hypothetical protein
LKQEHLEQSAEDAAVAWGGVSADGVVFHAQMFDGMAKQWPGAGSPAHRAVRIRSGRIGGHSFGPEEDECAVDAGNVFPAVHSTGSDPYDDSPFEDVWDEIDRDSAVPGVDEGDHVEVGSLHCWGGVPRRHRSQLGEGQRFDIRAGVEPIVETQSAQYIVVSVFHHDKT